VFVLCGILFSCGVPIPQDGENPRFDLHSQPKGSDNRPYMEGEDGEKEGFEFHRAASLSINRHKAVNLSRNSTGFSPRLSASMMRMFREESFVLRA
jgi:hypothetical protein